MIAFARPGVAVLLLLAACLNLEPSFVSKGDIDKAIGTRNETVLCAGLKQKDAETRSYAAEKFVTMDRVGTSCLCEHLKVDGKWDAAVLEGARKAKEDARAGCAATLLDDPAQPDRPGLAQALLDVRVPAVRARLVQAAQTDADPAVQAAAVPILTGSKDPAEVQVLVDGLKTRPPEWVLAATKALAGQPSAAAGLREAATTHVDPAVRAAALDAYRQVKAADYAEVVCAAMAKDPDATVRSAAIGMVKSSRDATILACLRERATTPEPDAAVRLVLLQTLAKTAAPEAAAILCDAVPFWVRTYVSDTPVQAESAEDILFYQNDRDFERSYECAEKAVKAGGYTCWGKAYVGARFQEFGGKKSFPRCPGAAVPGGGSGREVTF